MNRRDFYKNTLGLLSFAAIPSLSFSTTSAMEKKKYPKKLIKPKRLKPGDTIGLVAPASSFSDSRWQKTIKNIEALGFKTKYDEKRILSKYGYLAGKDDARAKEINDMFADKEVDGIWCVRGGYGSARILPMLDYGVIRKNPKVLIGYSDITALLQGIFLKTGLVCFHGPVGASEFTDYTQTHVLELLTNPKPNTIIQLSEENLSKSDKSYQPFVINEGTATGALVGGNLTLVTSLIGTPYELDLKGKILFLEDIGEKPYRIDRMLTQLLLGGKLDQVAGIALGVFNDCEATGNTLTLEETLQDRLAHLNCPIFYGLSFGHISNQFTLPLGIKTQLNTRKRTLTLLENSVV